MTQVLFCPFNQTRLQKNITVVNGGQNVDHFKLSVMGLELFRILRTKSNLGYILGEKYIYIYIYIFLVSIKMH